jgi:hypothetical protein
LGIAISRDQFLDAGYQLKYGPCVAKHKRINITWTRMRPTLANSSIFGILFSLRLPALALSAHFLQIILDIIIDVDYLVLQGNG